MAAGPAKILEIGNYPPPYCGWSTRTKFLVERLQQEGVECRVLDIGPSRKVRRPGCIDVQNGPDYLRKLLRFARRGYHFHVHANGDSPKGFVLALLALGIGRMTGRRGILTFHAGLRQRFFPRKTLPWKVFFRVFFGLPAAVVCNSEPVRREIASYGISPARVHAIPAFSRQYVEAGADRDELPEGVAGFVESHAPVLVCYAYPRPEFALEGFFDAARELVEDRPSLGIVLVGDFERGDPYLSLAADLGLGNRILAAGTLKRKAFLATLAASDLYVRTHLRDGVSSSVLESLALGTPVVAAENETRPEGVRTYPGERQEGLLEAMREEVARLDAEDLAPEAPDPGDTVGREARVIRRVAGDTTVDVTPSHSAA